MTAVSTDEGERREPFDCDRIIAELRGSSSPPGPPRLPACLPQALTSAYFASLFQYEGRPVRCSLALGRVELGLDYSSKLQDPLPLNAESIRRLAPSIDYRRTSLQVSDESRGRVVGLLERPSYLGFTRLDDRCIIDVRGSGDVGLSQGETEVRYRRGKYETIHLHRVFDEFLPSTWAKPAAQQVFPGLAAVSTGRARLEFAFHGGLAVDWNAVQDGPRGVEALTAVAARGATGLAMRLVAERMADAGHGGSLLVLGPDSGGLDDFVLGAYTLSDSVPVPGITDESDVQRRRWNTGARHFAELRLIMSLWKAGIVRREGTKAGPVVENGAEFPDMLSRSAAAALHSECDRTARLTQIDGGVVLGPAMVPTAIGAKFKTANADSLPHAFKERVNGRGNRHLSLACAVHAAGDAIGIVVSQDGDALLLRADADGKRHAHSLHL